MSKATFELIDCLDSWLPSSSTDFLAKIAFVAIFAVRVSRAILGIIAHGAKLAILATGLQVEDSASSVAHHISI